jgi:hypothetical protein
MSTDDAHSGIPTRAIHESYLDMHRALKSYRQATDRADGRGRDQAHGDLQSAVLTCFDLLRPHLRSETAVEDYWQGKPPRYGGGTPDPEDGTAVLETQSHTTRVKLNGHLEGVDVGNLTTLEQWHDVLGIADHRRLTNVVPPGMASLPDGQDQTLIQYQEYQLGLRRLDDWQTSWQTTLVQDDAGFFGQEERTETRRQRVPIHKLRRAARALSEVANRLGALSDFDASTQVTEITRDDLEKVEEWRQNQI